MGHVKVTSHFYKNGRVTGYGKRETLGRKFLSRFVHTIGWMGTGQDGEYMFTLNVDDKRIAYIRYNKSTREHTVQLGADKNWELDVDLHRLLNIKLDQVHTQEIKLPGDWVTVDGLPAVVAAPHRLEMVWDEELGRKLPINWIKVTFLGDETPREVLLKKVSFIP